MAAKTILNIDKEQACFNKSDNNKINSRWHDGGCHKSLKLRKYEDKNLHDRTFDAHYR